jgi:hypothetical protein
MRLSKEFDLVPTRMDAGSARRDAGAVEEADAPGACLFLEHCGFNPAKVLCAGCILYRASVDVGDPRQMAIGFDMGLGDRPHKDFAAAVE